MSVLRKESAGRIGGTPAEQDEFSEKVTAAFPECFWIDACAPPMVRDHVSSFRLEPNAKPVARQPDLVSPHDDAPVAIHVAENLAQGKLWKIYVTKVALPERSTPAFVVDQDTRGLLGRTVCAYDRVNKKLEITTFPSADPTRAELAAFEDRHTLGNAIWGYTQFLIDKPTARILTICSRSGLPAWTRMPFGPAPAPAEMQRYVHVRFGSLRGRGGREFVSPCVEDIKLSSKGFQKHIEDMRIVCARAT